MSKFFNQTPKSFGCATIARHNIKHVLWRAISACVALYSRPDLKLGSTFPSIQFLTNGFSVPHWLDRNSKGGGILLYVRDKIIVLLSSTAYWDFILWIKSKEPKMACMLFLQSPQKLNQRLFTSTYRRYSVLLNANGRGKNLGQKRTSRKSSWYWRVRWRWWSNKRRRGQ